MGFCCCCCLSCFETFLAVLIALKSSVEFGCDLIRSLGNSLETQWIRNAESGINSGNEVAFLRSGSPFRVDLVLIGLIRNSLGTSTSPECGIRKEMGDASRIDGLICMLAPCRIFNWNWIIPEPCVGSFQPCLTELLIRCCRKEFRPSRFLRWIFNFPRDPLASLLEIDGSPVAFN